MKTLKIYVALITMFMTFSLNAQDPFLQYDDPIQEKIAWDLTKEFNKQLALDGDQIPLFQKKIEEFLIRAEKIKERYEGKEMLDMLYALRKRETAEMGNILTLPQLRLYDRIKMDIQPLYVVPESDSK